MKKLLCIFTLLLCCCLLAVTAMAADTNVWYCQHCKKDVTWEVMPSSFASLTGHKHYYLAADVTPGQLLSTDGNALTVCLDLKGFGIDTNGRSGIIKENCVWSIMDSSAAGTGYICGSRGNNNAKGGTLSVRSTGTLNLYSGTLTFQMDDVGNQKTNQAAVAYLQSGAKMNIYGGTVKGGELMQNGTAVSSGGAISVAGGATLRVSGGRITSGILPETGVGPCVYAEGTTASIVLENDAYVDEIYASAGVVKVNGAFSGKAWLELNGNPSAGLTVGSCQSTAITGELFCINGNGWLVTQSGTSLKLAAFTPTAQRHLCAACDKVVKWTALTETACASVINTTAGNYHYYLNGNFQRSSQLTAVENTTVCLDLNGNTYTSTVRALYLRAGSTMSVMDFAGGGSIAATTGSNNPSGGVMVIKGNATFNLYGGTLLLNDKYVAGRGVGLGGIVYMVDTGAAFNLYDGTVQGANLVVSEYEMTPNGCGAAFYMSGATKLNVFGGRITAGTLASGCVGECVYLASKSPKVTVAGNGSIDDIYCTGENDQLTVSGAYTGTVRLTYPDSVTLKADLVVGASDNANLTNADTGCGSQWMLEVSGNSLVLVPNAPAVTVNDGVYTRHESLQAAVDNAQGGLVKLMQSVTENVTVSQNVYLDLNGKTVHGTVTVNAGATLYGMDSQTDDFTVSDSVGYGKLTATGEGRVLGAGENTGFAQQGYLKVTESDGISFHAISLKITATVLRPGDAGIYYQSAFGGDEVVAEQIEEYGVALSADKIPTAFNLDTACQRSVYTGFTPGAKTVTSTLLKNVLKTTNTAEQNKENAQLSIYGRAYIRTQDGYIFSAYNHRSFREVVEGANTIWSDLNGAQKTAMVALYSQFEAVMQDWAVDRIQAQKDPSSDGVLKILGIGNSYTGDSMQMLYNVYKAENPDKEVVICYAYYGGCSLAQHVGFIQDNEAAYTYYRLDDEVYAAKGGWQSTKNVTLGTILEDDNWDIVTMQQASTYSGVASTYNKDIDTIQTYVKDCLGYTPTFAWNMTWAYPVKDIEGDAFVTVNTSSGFAKYNNDQMTMYNAIVSTVKEKIVPNKTFTYLMPAGIAVQNSNTSYLDDPDLYRDYTHLNDFARVMAAYVWYCEFENVELEQLKFTVVPEALTKSYKTAGGTGDMVLTQMEQAIIVESVNNAIKAKNAGTFAVTQSVYTTP